MQRHLELSPDQIEALSRWDRWRTSMDPEFYLGGLAGTGKTTVLRHVRDNWDCRILAPTNKAASVLKQKGIVANTVSSFLDTFLGREYDDEGKKILKFRDKRAKDTNVVIDEASMISELDRSRILEAVDKVLWVGDHGQLKPVRGKAIMHQARLNAELTHVHRQGEGSQILEFARFLRKGGLPCEWKQEPKEVHCVRKTDLAKIAQGYQKFNADVCLAFMNRTIEDLNRAIMKKYGFSALAPGARCCAYTNSKGHSVSNGEVYTIQEMYERAAKGSDAPETATETWIETKCGRAFPWVPEEPLSDHRKVYVQPGYALTVHKSQGSEWDTVFVLEDFPSGTSPNWRYTAATRAKKKLIYLY